MFVDLTKKRFKCRIVAIYGWKRKRHDDEQMIDETMKMGEQRANEKWKADFSNLILIEKNEFG